MGYQQGEIPMTNVHGIAVAGGTFPAEIWRLFMEKALENEPTRDFLLPNTYPTYKDWHGEWQYGGGSYTPTPDYSTPAPTTTTTTTTQTAQAPPPATHPKEKRRNRRRLPHRRLPRRR